MWEGIVVGRRPRLRSSREAKSVCVSRDCLTVSLRRGRDRGLIKASTMNDSEAGTSGGAVREDFDVFLNHRGPDVKATFVAHLEEALRCAGFRPFLDGRSLMKGDPALKSIDEALDMAKVHVAVVSTGYAESKYCLNELVAMVRSGKPVVPVFYGVVPVFYGVEPGELRRVEEGPFAEAFEKHERRGRTETKLQEWKDALGALAGLSGFRLADYMRDEAQLKREVVNEVVRLTPSNQPIAMDPFMVGLTGPTKTCVELLENMSNGVGILGLVGMGGVGKTTLAREVYNHYVGQRKFRCMTFLEVHRNSTSSDVQVRVASSDNLQEQLLWDLLRVQDCTLNYGSWFKKVAVLGSVLIVIDDVYKLSEFESLVPSASILHQGSYIIITSRDSHVLNNAMGRSNVHCQVYDVSPLAWEEANMLFNLHAFNAEEAPMDYVDVAKNVVKGCGGLPLALKVMGCHLYDKRLDGDRETIWVEAIDVLKRSKDVMDVLRWSYDSLSEAEKLMFLDITCVFYDKTMEEAMACWRGCKNICCGDICTLHTSMRNLISKNLVVKRDASKGYIGVHDLLKDLGHEIAMKMKRHFHDYRVLEATRRENEAIINTIGVNLEGSCKQKFKATTFASMPNLHYLRLPNGCNVNGNFGSMPKKMRLLQWRGMPLASIPIELNMAYLVSLDFSESSKLAFMWSKSNDALKACRNLLKLNLSGCTSITKLPDSIGQLLRLKYLNLGGCNKLKKLPDSTGQLKQLEELSLSSCSSLKALPETLTNPNLYDLNLEVCASISKLPDSIGQLTALYILNLMECESLEGLPNTIGALSNLAYLDVRGCTSLVEIPSSISLLSSLRSLHIHGEGLYEPYTNGSIGGGWTKLKLLSLLSGGGIGSHRDYSTLQNLNYLWLWDDILTELPDSISLLLHLDDLTIACERLQSLPKSICNLRMLTSLALHHCKNLRRLPKALDALARLKRLEIEGCWNIKKLPKSVGLLSQLQELRLRQCKNLQRLPTSIKQLESLKCIKIRDCGSIEAMGALTTLQGLPLLGSTSITNLPASLGTISTLCICEGEDIPWYFKGAYETLEEDENGFWRAYQSSGVTRLLRCAHKKSAPSELARLEG